MRYLDPLPVRCASCKTESALPVRDLLALKAHCPVCHESLRENGLAMRHAIDEETCFYDALFIIMHVEEHCGITIPDEIVEAIAPWEDLTLRNLVTAVEQSVPVEGKTSAMDAVLAAVRDEFPNAPSSPDFEAPLLEAICHRIEYGLGY